MGIQDFIALTIVAAAAWWVVQKFRKGLGGCDSCECDASKATPTPPRPKVMPLVPPDQIGLPTLSSDAGNTDAPEK